ncbi:MAG: LysM peptidoglycan-binding domain-containing protein [Methanosarcinales archaeon]|nr:LysM peptidoglycan-binding domain-containing protein [Methanosarcinales archaeon]
MVESGISPELNKAIIHVLDAKGDKKYEVPVRFYPSEYTMEKSNEYAKKNIPGLDSPRLKFTRGNLETLSMDLIFDSYEEGKDVREYTDKISDLLKVDPAQHVPPVLKFVWGNVNFKCVLSKVQKKFTMFRPDGIPVRATLNVTFEEYRTKNDSKEKPKQSSDRTKVYTIRQKDSLWSIAAIEYGDPALWRPIADANKIINPRVLEPGREIAIPPLDS